MERLLLDVRFALRSLLRTPGFTFTAITTLAIVIGANTAILSLVDSLFLRPPASIREATTTPGQLVGITADYTDERGHRTRRANRLPYGDARTIIETSETLTTAATSSRDWLWLDTGDQGREAVGSAISGPYFELLGLRPSVGRLLQAADDRPGATPVVVLGHALWQQLGGASDLVDRTIRLNGTSVTVIGVAPPGFSGVWAGDDSMLWLPSQAARTILPYGEKALTSQRGWVDLVARIAPEHGLDEANAELSVLNRRLRIDATDPRRERLQFHVAAVGGIHPSGREESRATPTLLATASLLILVLACANLAGLAISRNSRRSREQALRLAIGASRQQVVGLALTESMLLALAGSALGLWVALGLHRWIAWFYGWRGEELALRIDLRALAMAAGLALVTSLAYGLAPALHASRTDLVRALRGGDDRRGGRLRAAMITIQVALALVFLTGAGLLGRSLGNAIIEPGFDMDGIAHARLRASRVGFDTDQADAFHRRLVERLTARPEVENIALASVAPGRGWCCSVPVSRPDQPPRSPEEALEVETNAVTPDFFQLVGIPLVAGRGFTQGDHRGTADVAIVNQSLARRLWGDDSPLGKTLQSEDRTYSVVGVSRDALPARAGERDVPFLYRAYWQTEATDARIFVAVDGPAEAFLPTLRSTMLEVDSRVPFGQEMTLAARTRMSHRPQQLIGSLLAAGALLALLLAALGLWGVATQSVLARNREIAIRTAVGARDADVLALIVRQNAAAVGLGMGIGLLSALALAGGLREQLYGVTSHDPATFTVAGIVLIVTALAATALPARRALRIDTASVLRRD